MRKFIFESFSDPRIRFYGMADVAYCLVYNFEDLKLVWGMLRLFLNKPHTAHNLSTWKTKGHSHHYHLIKTKPMNTFIQDKMRRWKKKLHRTIYHMRTLNRRHWYVRMVCTVYIRSCTYAILNCGKRSTCGFSWIFLLCAQKSLNVVIISHGCSCSLAIWFMLCVCQPIWRIALVKVSFRQAKCEQKEKNLRW